MHAATQLRLPVKCPVRAALHQRASNAPRIVPVIGQKDATSAAGPRAATLPSALIRIAPGFVHLAMHAKFAATVTKLNADFLVLAQVAKCVAKTIRAAIWDALPVVV